MKVAYSTTVTVRRNNNGHKLLAEEGQVFLHAGNFLSIYELTFDPLSATEESSEEEKSENADDGEGPQCARSSESNPVAARTRSKLKIIT